MTWILPLLALHLAAALLALIQGLRAWRAPRGTPAHRRLGRWYLAAILPMGVTAGILDALSGRASLTLLWLAVVCLCAGIATPLLALAPRAALRACHGFAACLSLACLGGAMVEVFHPGPWSWPIVGVLALFLRFLPAPLPRGAVAPLPERP